MMTTIGIPAEGQLYSEAEAVADGEAEASTEAVSEAGTSAAEEPEADFDKRICIFE